MAKVLLLPDVRASFAELGMEPVGNAPQEVALAIQSDLRKWAKVIKDSGAKAEQ